ncbi:hypothetical protein ACTXJ9_07350 [Brachybacterium tyrofermentans]|uniref:hypothetical protein n=1 Tax=Brachybacterium tyrofermentans TaxID=47848 RepID=UPI003FD42ABD
MRAPRQDQILPLAVGGVAAAALGTVPLHRLPRPLRTAYVVIPGALTAVLTYAALGQPGQQPARDAGPSPLTAAAEETEKEAATVGETAGADDPAGSVDVDEFADAIQKSEGFRLLLSLGIGSLIAGAGAAAIWVDHRVEDALRSRGVPAPRLIMGLATGAINVAISAFEVDEVDETEKSPESCS